MNKDIERLQKKILLKEQSMIDSTKDQVELISSILDRFIQDVELDNAKIVKATVIDSNEELHEKGLFELPLAQIEALLNKGKASLLKIDKSYAERNKGNHSDCIDEVKRFSRYCEELFYISESNFFGDEKAATADDVPTANSYQEWLSATLSIIDECLSLVSSLNTDEIHFTITILLALQQDVYKYIH